MTDAPRTQDHWNPERYERTAAFVSELGQPLLTLLAPEPGERILDLGCGDGTLALELQAAGCSVLAADASPAQVRAARARGLDARLLDGQQLAAAGEALGRFDAVFSNAALHWMPDQDAVFAGIAAVLPPGGRLVVEMGGAGNVATIRDALHAALAERGIDAAHRDPWTFPDEATTRDRLTRAGFDVTFMERFERPTPLPGPLSDWLETFAPTFLVELPDEVRASVFAAVEATCRPRLEHEGRWTADYVRLRFRAVRTG